ncbi:MAG: fumarate hydratase [Candidatus Delongbacteria bacterium]|nr:fumarate hydratase [Candidatus Delongbacteria bacterium]
MVHEILRVHFQVDPDWLTLIHRYRDQESLPSARAILGLIIRNSEIAAQDHLPLCQDTGTAVFDLEIGQELRLDHGDWETILNQAVEEAYRIGYLRRSIVSDPFRRINTGDNTPAIIHTHLIPGKTLTIRYCAKGGGAENKSRIKMFNPTAQPDNIKDFLVETIRLAGGEACPPLMVGVGLGGNFETAPLLAKKALFRPLLSEHPDPFYRHLETEWLEALNQSGVGVQGLGGSTSVLRLFIMAAPCHIASLPVAVNLNCHSHRQFSLQWPE